MGQGGLLTKDSNLITYQGKVLRRGYSYGIRINSITYEWNAEGTQAIITVTASGGVGTLEYRLDEGAWQQSNVFVVTESASYTIYVSDVVGNIVSELFALPEQFILLSTPEDFTFKNSAIENKIYIDEHERNAEIRDFDITSFQPTGKTYYVSTTGNNSNNGLTLETALLSIRTALEKSDCDVILIADGLYRSTQIASLVPHRSVSIKAINPGNVVVSMSNPMTWTLTSGRTNTYQATGTTTIRSVFDALNLDPRGDYLRHVELGTIDLVEATPGSYYRSGSTIYVHTIDSRVPDSNIYVYLSSYHILTNNYVQNIYIEGIEFHGGGMRFKAVAGNIPNVYMKNCKGRYIGYSLNGFDFYGTNSILENVIVSSSALDGIAYNSEGGIPCTAIEINCKSYNNGLPSETNNGSTAHSGSKVIRVSGEYYANRGPNVADVNANTQSWNVACVAYNSLSNNVNREGDFFVTTTCKMWNHSCVSYGSTYSVVLESVSQMENTNCDFQGGVRDDGSGNTLIIL